MEIKGWGKPPQNVKTNKDLAIIKTRLRKIEMMLIRIEGLCENPADRVINIVGKGDVKGNNLEVVK